MYREASVVFFATDASGARTWELFTSMAQSDSFRAVRASARWRTQAIVVGVGGVLHRSAAGGRSRRALRADHELDLRKRARILTRIRVGYAARRERPYPCLSPSAARSETAASAAFPMGAESAPTMVRGKAVYCWAKVEPAAAFRVTRLESRAGTQGVINGLPGGFLLVPEWGEVEGAGPTVLSSTVEIEVEVGDEKLQGTASFEVLFADWARSRMGTI